MTEQALLRAARDGDRAAIRELYHRHAGRVHAVTLRLLGDEAQAEDAAQDAWVQALRALPGFRGEASFGAWLHRIAVNAALQCARRRTRRQRREVPLSGPLPAAGTDSDPLLPGRLERAIARLPEGMRTVLVLHDVEGLTHGEIGQRLGIAAGTSKSQLFKARAKMRALLRPTMEEDPERWTTSRTQGDT